MARWLLSGRNPRESFGISYPITATFYTEFVARRQYEALLGALAGGNDGFDLSMAAMLQFHGSMYMNISGVARNLPLVLPFDPTSLGAPPGLVTTDARPHLSTRLLLPFRLWGLYRQTARAYRTVIPAYRRMLEETYWALHDCDSRRLAPQDLGRILRLLAPATLAATACFVAALNMVTMANIAVAQVVNQHAPELLSLLVDHGTSTALLGEQMWRLSRTAWECGPEVVALLRQGPADLRAYRNLPAAALLVQGIERFLRTYGHRAFHYAAEFEATRLADQPHLVLATIAALLDEDKPPSVQAEAAGQAGRQALRKRGPLQRLPWSRLLRLGSALIELREAGRDTMELQNATWGLAARLLSHYYLPDCPPDTLWLYTFDEFLAFGQSRGQKWVAPQVLARRRAELEHYHQAKPLPELIWYDPDTEDWWPVHEEKAEAARFTPGLCLQGIGVSAGSGPVEGLAMVTDDVQTATARLRQTPGPVILVTAVTDPVWSSLFARLKAVVTEMGGVISHAAIIARGNGIPAVVGVPAATARLHDGQRLRVDGQAGTVEILADTLEPVSAGLIPAAIDEVRSIVEQTAQRAQGVADMAQRTAQVSQAGQQAVAESISGMEEIEQKVATIARNVLALSDQAQAVGQIIAAASEIAAQSNMLALNAAVETARASEAGRGFASVAGEVRALAHWSRAATVQVKELLSEIQRGVDTAVMTTEEGIKGAGAGVRLTEEAGRSIRNLAESMGESAMAAQQIAAAAGQQLVGMEQVVQALQSIEQASTQNVAGALQVKQAAHQLSLLSGQLRELVEQYEL
jgi:phosphohistidine swiveling domain-containing protein